MSKDVGPKNLHPNQLIIKQTPYLLKLNDKQNSKV